MVTFAESSSTSTSQRSSQMCWSGWEENPYGIIKKIDELYPQKVIRVTFTNGDVQKAVCSDEDDFDFERGIEVCICKHYLGGTKEFNKQLRQGLKCWDDACEAEMDRLQEEARIRRKKKKRAEQKERRAERREQEERERQIEIQTEAILRANDIMGTRAKRARAKARAIIKEKEGYNE